MKWLAAIFSAMLLLASAGTVMAQERREVMVGGQVYECVVITEVYGLCAPARSTPVPRQATALPAPATPAPGDGAAPCRRGRVCD
jgi:hypothetical protein